MRETAVPSPDGRRRRLPTTAGSTSFTSTHDSGDSFAVGSTTVTYTAMDAAGNTTTASFTVTVTDDEDPAISGMPADISKTNDAGNCSAVALSWTEPTAADNCAIASTFTSTHSPGDAFAVGTTTVTYTATDIHGNSSTASFDITVTDDEDPSISGMPADITQTADAGLCSAGHHLGRPLGGGQLCGGDVHLQPQQRRRLRSGHHDRDPTRRRTSTATRPPARLT